MNAETLVNSNLQRLARQLESDLNQKGLVPGDPYMSAGKAAEYLGVSRMTANRALNLLAEREILIRHRNHGTFVGPGIEQIQKQEAGYIDYLSFADITPTFTLPIGKMLTGLRRAMPDVAFQQHFSSPEFASPNFGSTAKTLNYTRQAIDAARSNPMCKGIVGCLCTREVQQLLADCDLPVVLFGSVYPGIDLPSVDVDQQECGRLLAKRALEAGFKRMVFANHEIWCQGISLLFNGILEVIQASNLGCNSLVTQNFSQDAQSMQAEIEYTLQEVRSPTAILAQSPSVVHAITRMLTRLEISPDEVRVFYADDINSPSDSFSDALGVEPAVQCTVSLEDQFEVIGQMMVKLCNKQPLECKHFVVPVH